MSFKKNSHMIAKCSQVREPLLEACLPKSGLVSGALSKRTHHPPLGRCFGNSTGRHARVEQGNKTRQSKPWLTPFLQVHCQMTSPVHKWVPQVSWEEEPLPPEIPTYDRRHTVSYPNCHSLVYFPSPKRGKQEPGICLTQGQCGCRSFSMTPETSLLLGM